MPSLRTVLFSELQSLNMILGTILLTGLFQIVTYLKLWISTICGDSDTDRVPMIQWVWFLSKGCEDQNTVASLLDLPNLLNVGRRRKGWKFTVYFYLREILDNFQ